MLEFNFVHVHIHVYLKTKQNGVEAVLWIR